VIVGGMGMTGDTGRPSARFSVNESRGGATRHASDASQPETPIPDNFEFSSF
jgi:hypothetical protein